MCTDLHVVVDLRGEVDEENEWSDAEHEKPGPVVVVDGVVCNESKFFTYESLTGKGKHTFDHGCKDCFMI